MWKKKDEPGWVVCHACLEHGDGFVVLPDTLYPSVCHEPLINRVRREEERKKSNMELAIYLGSIACK